MSHSQEKNYRPRAVSIIKSETRIGRWQAFNSFTTVRAFSQRGRKNKVCRVLHDPVGRTPRHACRNFRAEDGLSILPVFNFKQNLARKLDPRLKPSHLKEITYVAHIYACRSKRPGRFWDTDPEILHTFSACPCRGLTRVFFSFFFFDEQYWAKVGPHFPKNLSWQKSRRKQRTRQEHRVRPSQGHVEDMCKISRSES